MAVNTLCFLWVCCFLEPASPLAQEMGEMVACHCHSAFYKFLNSAMEWSDWTGCWYQVLRWVRDGCLCPWQAWGRCWSLCTQPS